MDTAKLLKSIKRRARLQLVSLPAGSTTDFLEIMNEVFANEILPTILTFREEFYVHTTTWSKEDTQFRIPSDAIGNKFRGIYLLDQTGRRARPIPLKNIDASGAVAPNAIYTRFGYIPGVIMMDNYLEVEVPTPNDMQVAYYRMPNKLIYFDSTTPQATATDKVYQVASVSGANLTLTNPAPLTSTGTPVEYDLIHSEYPYEKRGRITVTFTTPFSANPQTATYTGDTVPEVGDWLFLPGYSGFANIPREAELYFVLACASAILNFLGAAEWEQVEKKKLDQLAIMTNLLDPRDDGSPWTTFDIRGAFDYL